MLVPGSLWVEWGKQMLSINVFVLRTSDDVGCPLPLTRLTCRYYLDKSAEYSIGSVRCRDGGAQVVGESG